VSDLNQIFFSRQRLEKKEEVMAHDKDAATLAKENHRRHEAAILRLWESYDLVTDIPAQRLILFAIERLLDR
jgi:hypothetical protein